MLVTGSDDDDANWLISERAAAAEQTVDETRPSTSEEASKDDESSGRDDMITDQMKDTISADTAAAAGDVAMDTATSCPSELPFQVQITYTDLDGAEAVRVLTQTQPVTRDRQQAETSTALSDSVCLVTSLGLLHILTQMINIKTFLAIIMLWYEHYDEVLDGFTLRKV